MKLNKILSLLGLLLERRCCSCPPTGPGQDGPPALDLYLLIPAHHRLWGSGDDPLNTGGAAQTVQLEVQGCGKVGNASSGAAHRDGCGVCCTALNEASVDLRLEQPRCESRQI